MLAYIFMLKVLARIWDPEAYLFPGIVGVFAGVFFFGGVCQCSRWRKCLGIVWICLAALAAFNSTQYESFTNLPQFPGFRTEPPVLRAMSRASILMSVAAIIFGISLLVWQRRLDRAGT